MKEGQFDTYQQYACDSKTARIFQRFRRGAYSVRTHALFTLCLDWRAMIVKNLLKNVFEAPQWLRFRLCLFVFLTFKSCGLRSKGIRQVDLAPGLTAS